jgi:hypothetical protein
MSAALYRQRLLNVALALRESPAPDRFTMVMWGHPCGTPACALGHYACRPDLQDTFALFWQRPNPLLGLLIQGKRFITSEIVWGAIGEHFGITADEVTRLFGLLGCNGAKTPEAAIAYIEQFVDHKFPLPQWDPAFEKFRETLQQPAAEIA